MTTAVPNAPEGIALRVHSERVGWRWPLVVAFIRLPLIAVGLRAATVFFALHGWRTRSC